MQFVGEDVEQHFGIGAGVDVAQVFVAHAAVELVGVGEVAVVRQHDAEGGADVEGLGFGGAAGVAGGGVAHVADAGVARELSHVAGAEHFAHHAFAFVHVEGRTVQGGDAGRVLPPVLQHLQAVIQKLVDRFVGDKAENSAHEMISEWLKCPQGGRRFAGLRRRPSESAFSDGLCKTKRGDGMLFSRRSG